MNQKGFSPIIVVLIVAAILIVGGILYYEAHAPSSGQSISSSSSSPFLIPEWGLEFRVPTALSGLVYTISNKQDQAAVATFSTNDLESIAPSCSPNISQGIGALSRWLYSASDTAPGVHIGAYTYAFIEASGNCAEPGYLPGGNFTVTASTQLFIKESSQLETAIDNTLTSTTVYGVIQQVTSTATSSGINGSIGTTVKRP